MSRLTDYAAKMRGLQTPFTAGQQPVQPQQPQITMPTDGNYIGWMADMMGPTPAEREAQERRLAENKAKMKGWTGFFQGLGALGDLLYAPKGVTPSKPTYDPQRQIDQNFAEEKQRLDDLYKNRQVYASMLYNLQRQAGEDQRKDKLADAQAQWYSTRDEMARDKAELERMKAVKVIKNKDGSLMKFDPISGTAENLTEADPLYIDYMRSQINKNNRMGYGHGGNGGRGANNGTYGYETMVTEGYDESGNRWKKTVRTPTTGGKPESSSQVQRRKQAANKPKQEKPQKSAPAKAGKKNTTARNTSGFFNK